MWKRRAQQLSPEMLISLTLHLSSCHLQGPASLQSIIYCSAPRSSTGHSLLLPMHTGETWEGVPGKYFLLWSPKRWKWGGLVTQHLMF